MRPGKQTVIPDLYDDTQVGVNCVHLVQPTDDRQATVRVRCNYEADDVVIVVYHVTYLHGDDLLCKGEEES